ncbi:MAG TPA: GNAT family N-acetyltransferase [Streptosporangiaceae bacterium]
MTPRLLVVPQLGRWAAPWDQLVDASPLPTPFLRSWWLTGTGGSRSRFLLSVQDGQLVGGLALEAGRLLGQTCWRMCGAGSLCPDHLDLLSAPGHQETVAAAARAWLRRPGGRILDLAGVPAGSPLRMILPAPVSSEALAVAPWASLPADPSSYLAARPAGFRKTLRKATARMAAAGASHRANRGASAVRSLERLRQMHTAQWGSRSGFLPGFDRFAAACRLGAEADEIAVHEIATEEAIIATMVTFEVAGRLSLYQSARLTDFQWRDVTLVLLAAVISDACERGFAEVDFLRGDESYKTNFACQQRELVRLRTATTAAGRAILAADSLVRSARSAAARSVLRMRR